MVSKDMPEGCTTIFIGNLSWDVSEEVVREAFKDCGEIKVRNLGPDKGC
jgi:nucleolin